MASRSGKIGRTLAILGARFEAMLGGMTARDRKLFVGLTGLAVLLLIVGVGVMMSRSLSSLRGDIAESEQQLVQTSDIRDQYEADLARILELEETLREHENSDLSAFLETAATSADVRDRLNSVRETSVTTLDGLEQRNYTVNLSSMTLPQMINFLYEAEAGSYPLSIQSANIRTSRRGEEKQMTVKLDVASFHLVEEGE
jgi:hypothetical protein